MWSGISATLMNYLQKWMIIIVCWINYQLGMKLKFPIIIAVCFVLIKNNTISSKIAKEIFERGVDVITLVNHSWDKREIYNYIIEQKNLIIPINYTNVIPEKQVICHRKKYDPKI